MPGRSSQKGVEAIFSSPKKQREARIIFGAIALFTGICSIIISMIIDQFPHLVSSSPVASYGSLEFASLGAFVLTCGLGIIISSFQMPDLGSTRATLSDISPSPLPTASGVRDSNLSASPSSHLNLRLGLTVFLQGSILLALYTGLVQEYQSNTTMQEWIRSSLDNAQYFLNLEALLLGSIFVGILVVYSLVTKDLVD